MFVLICKVNISYKDKTFSIPLSKSFRNLAEQTFVAYISFTTYFQHIDSAFQVSDVNAKKYITRTSNAGTLLLCEEESYPQKTSGKRSRQASKGNSIDNAAFSLCNGDGFTPEKTYQRYSRYKSDPTKGRSVERMRHDRTDRSR